MRSDFTELPLSRYKPGLSPDTVQVVESLSLADPQRGREITLKLYYPACPGPLPVIVFSHGTGGSKDAFSHLSHCWASYGYIAVHPTHLDGCLRLSRRERQSHRQRVRTDPWLWQDRARDISFVLDALDDLERQVPALAGKLDRSRIGVAGHSFGAFTTLLLAGTLVDTPPLQKLQVRDARVCAFLAISPQGTGEWGLNSASWAGVEAPVMTVSGTEERGADWRMEPFNYMRPGHKYHVLVDGASHSAYNDYRPGKLVAGHSEKLSSQIHACVQSFSTAFWDTYLKQQPLAKAYLTANPHAVPGAGKVSIFVK